MNGNDNNPRSHISVRELIQTCKLQTAAYKKSHLNDRIEGNPLFVTTYNLSSLSVLGTFLDGYCTQEEWSTICREGLQRNSVEGLRDRTMAMVSHYGLLRGENVRGMQLPDVHSLTLENEGPTRCEALVILLLNGKTNQEGRTEFMGAIRNKSWEACPIGALALYLFYRSVNTS